MNHGRRKPTVTPHGFHIKYSLTIRGRYEWAKNQIKESRKCFSYDYN